MAHEEFLTVHDKEVRVHVMNEFEVVSGCWGDRDEPSHTGEAFQQWLREIVRRYRAAGAVALCEETIVGYVSFYPDLLNASFREAKTGLCPCMDAALATLMERMIWPHEPGDALALGCVNMAPSVRRSGVGSALVRTAVEWARENGYRIVLASANDTQWWVPCRPFWEKLGFHVKNTIEFATPREDGEVREYIMELSLP